MSVWVKKRNEMKRRERERMVHVHERLSRYYVRENVITDGWCDCL